MKDRSKILTQILIVVEQYDLEIVNINFTNVNTLKDKVEFTFKHEQDKIIFRYLYEKDGIYGINSFANHLRNELNNRLKEGKIND